MGHFPSCSICIEVFVNFGDVSASPCGHTFHRECLTSWASQCESKGQLPTCPTCSKPFESGPAKGIIESLFFSFDADGQSGDEFLAKQMNENVKLSEDVAARDAEIRDLRAKLARSEADLKELRETLEKEKKTRESRAEEGRVAVTKTLREQLAISEANLKALQDTVEKEEKAQEKKFCFEFAAQAAAYAIEKIDLEEQLSFSKSDAKLFKERFLDVEEELRDIRERRDFISKWKSDCSRHVVISNLHEKVHSNQLRARLAKWKPKTVRMYVDQCGIQTAYITLRNSDDAHEVIERLHGIDWYNVRMIVRHAMGEEAQELGERDLVVSNIRPAASKKAFENLIREFDEDDDRVRHIEFDETPGLKKLIVSFSTSCDAKAFFRQYNGHFFQGKPLEVKLYSCRD